MRQQRLASLISRFDGRDLIVIIALTLMAIGLAMLSIPAAFIVPGALLFLLAVWPLLILPGGKG